MDKSSKRKNVELKGGWLSQVQDGVPFSFVQALPQKPEQQRTLKISRQAVRTMGELWTPQEVATYLRVHRDTVYGWIYEKRIPVKRAGRLIRIEVSALEEFLSCA